jgi:PQQ-dependent dehydrogenase (methanol/ethanol family)
MMGRKAWLLATALLAVSCKPSMDMTAPGAVNADMLLKAASNTEDWLTYGRTYDEQRFSPLDKINRETVKDLGLAWFADLDTARGQEATPIVIDGKIYITTAWSKVKAYDGVTGKLLWEFDPEVPGETGVKACCDVVNRGLAAWGNRLYFGTLDGRLIALDRDTGKPVWEKVTVDQSQQYTVTGAPRIIDGKVIIGNGGAEMGARGYITAYDADSGDQLWRFHTVPGKPGENEAEPHLKKAEATWSGDYWAQGGGGTVWDAMAYDPELDLLYIGVGNGSPWNHTIRSAGKGDNLYLSSVVAIRPKTGEYVWHYQTTPAETWDYTATQHIILADLTIDGKPRKVLMQAPKNGFFYVLDRTNGQFISANNYVPVNWATGIDPKTGRPIENPEARADRTGKPFIVTPGPLGGHNWHPMAFDPKSGLVFIPSMETVNLYAPQPGWKKAAQGFNVGYDFEPGSMPADPKVRAQFAATTRGALIAWDPVAQKERWRVQFKGPWNGGMLATAGGLVFQGNSAGDFAAYSTDNGAKLWSFPAQTGVVASAATYTINGEQYVAVLAGWGGAFPITAGVLQDVAGAVKNISRLLVFKLGGTAKLPPVPPLNAIPLDPPPFQAKLEVAAAGKALYARYCGVCHGDAAVGGSVLPDLRRSATLSNAQTWREIVHGGALKGNGMASFANVMSAEQAETVRHFVIKRANEDKALGGT